MCPCYFCERECDEDRDLFSTVADSYLHARCLTWALNKRTEYRADLHALAAEFGRLRGNHTRRAFECRNGHAYTPENTYIDTQGHQGCRICIRAHNERYRDRNGTAINERRRTFTKTLGVVAPPELIKRVRAAAGQAGLAVSPYVRDVLTANLPALEAKLAKIGTP